MMIQIITGPRHCGKTSRLLSMFAANQSGDGFVSIKQIYPGGNQTSGYHLLHLSSQTSYPLARRSRIRHSRFAPASPYRLGDFEFFPAAFTQSESLLALLIQNRIQPIYLDEIGLLELNDHGFAPILPRLIESGLDLVLSIRERYLAQTIAKFSLPSPTIIPISPFPAELHIP